VCTKSDVSGMGTEGDVAAFVAERARMPIRLTMLYTSAQRVCEDRLHRHGTIVTLGYEPPGPTRC
jgi:hypothetical protein